MKKLHYVLAIICIALFTLSASAQTTYIPDANFLQALKDLGHGEGAVGNNVPTANLNTIKILDVKEKNIKDLTGIADFVALEKLFCQWNKLTSLDVSKNINLEYLNCSYNKTLENLDVSKNIKLTVLSCNTALLSSLDVTKNVALERLDCAGNELSSLDVSKNTALTQLACGRNQFAILDLSQNVALNYLSCSSGTKKLKNLDVSNNTALTTLYCNYNELTSLDLSKNIALTSLECCYNDLTSLDLSENKNLIKLDCSQNDLRNLDIRNENNVKITAFDARNNPNLTCIYVDNKEASYLTSWKKDATANFVNNEDECAYTYVPDAVFLQAIIDLGYGAGVVGNNVPKANINGITELKVSGKTIADLTGIEGFVALKVLKCDGNQLTRLDVSKNTALTYLDCEQNKLTSLDVSNNTALTYLNCGDNQITNLDLSKNTVLVIISCYENQLLSIDMRNGNNKNVESFWAATNPNLRCIYVDDKTDARIYDWSVDGNSIFVDNEAECDAVSVNGMDEQAISVYPNPTPGILNFDFAGENVKGIRISDITGKTIFEKTNVNQTETIDLSNFANGLYLVILQSENGTQPFKIVKE